jgi:hypothetical protein|tara:strand:+ start:305 stop:451 length:147 start_codon:yes stop_codon:yes gene_type:complete
MKQSRNKEFSTIRKLKKQVIDLEKRCEEIELIVITMLQNLAGKLEKKL